MLASAQATEALLQRCSHALACRVASPDTRRLSLERLDWNGSGISVASALAVAVTGCHLCSAVASPPFSLQCQVGTV
jgi:hypothetical protein